MRILVMLNPTNKQGTKNDLAIPITPLIIKK